MRLLINAASANMGGAVTYLANLLRWLPNQDLEVEADVYLPRVTRDRIGPALESETIRLHPFPHRHTGGARRFIFDQIEIPRLARVHGSDVLFSSTGVGTLRSPIPQLLLVRNTLPFLPGVGEASAGVGARLRLMLSVLSVRAADRVLLPTAAMLDVIAPHVSIGSDRFHVIHYGFDGDEFLTKATARPPVVEEMERLRRDGVRLVLNVSHYARHKNLEVLPRAMARLMGEGRRLKLVLTIPEATDEDRSPEFLAFHRQVEAELPGAVIRTGALPHEQLVHLYRAADLFVFPSLTESFGHPMVEAMAAGLPVVASDTAVNREICGSAGVYFPPEDSEAAAVAIADLLDDSTTLQRMSSAAEERASAFSWARYARCFLDVCAGMRHPPPEPAGHSGFPPLPEER
jgi:glycosyltransferase involved in cell wall biosynthesis